MRLAFVLFLGIVLGGPRFAETSPRGQIYQDLTQFWSELRQHRDQMRAIYLEQSQFLKKEKMEQGSTLFKNSKEILKAARRLIQRHRRVYASESVMLKILESRIEGTFSQLRQYGVKITKISPLELHAKRMGLRIGKLLEKRKFISLKTGKLVPGSALVEKLKSAYFFFYLKSKATLSRAEKILEPVVGEYPGFLPGLFWMARIYFEQERVEEAGKLLDRVLELDPELKIAASLSEKMLTGEDFLEYSLPRVSLQNGPPEPAPKSVDSLKSRDVWRVPFAVAISNTKSDRPQSGLDLAERVYEFPIEDGNTILLACYGLVDMAATPLGPVTRLDSYFLEEVFPLDPLMIHKGSSPGGTRTAKKLGMEMVDQKIGYDAFWDILKPDTKPKTFTSLQRLKDIAYTRGIIAGNIFKGLKITKTGHPYEENRILSLHIPFSKNYTVSYRFSQQTGQYLRSINGVLHQDAESGATLQAENLIVQMVDEIVLSPSRLKTIQVIGSGKLHSFVKGKYFEGTWKRPSIEAYTQYYDQKGNEVFLLPGKTWIHFLSNHSSIKVETWKKVSGGEG